MTYFVCMSRLLRFDMELFNTFNAKKRQYTCMMNVAILGLLYGLSAASFSNVLLVRQGLQPQAVNLVKIVVAGLPTAFLMHAGAALFVWVFLKAIGGKASFLLAYFDMGVAAISVWPLAPVTAALQAGIRSDWLLIAGVCLALYGFAVNLRVLKKTFCLSQGRMVTATSVTVIYIGCFLYLWM